MPGLIWKKLDLHVHTPASDCFVGSDCAASSDRQDVSPEMVVQAAIDNMNQQELQGRALNVNKARPRSEGGRGGGRGGGFRRGY